MNSSIIKAIGFDSKKKATDQEMVGKLAGLNMVRLQHRLGFHEFDATMKGFQGGTIDMSSRNNVRKYIFAPHKDRFGKDVATPTPLIFRPDETTGQLLAVIPMTKFNKIFLAKLQGNPKCPTIIDNAELQAEITEMAKKYAKEKVLEKTKDESIVEISAENKELRKQLKAAKAAKVRVDNREEALASAAKRTAEATLLKVSDEFEEQIIVDVLKEKDGLIRNLIEEHGEDDYKKSDGYTKGVLPEIEKRLNEKLKEKGITTDVDN
jgi:hypothetical protein